MSFKIHHISKKTVWLALLLCCAACSLDIPYENQFSDPDAVATPEKARELLASAYAQLPDASFELSILADDFEPTELLPKDVNLANLYKWQPLQIEQLATSLWESYYSAIAIANATLDRAALMKGLSAGEQAALQAVVAEAKVMKAYCFFNLLRLFAPDWADGAEKEGVPMKRKLELESLPRATLKTCTDTIRTLLADALKTHYATSAEYWFSAHSARYLMAELELYAHNYEQAANLARTVIEEHGGYEALGNRTYRLLWSDAACAERIFSWFTVNSYYTAINMTKEQGDYVTVNSGLLGLYAPEDIRREATVFTFRLKDETLPEDKATVPCFGKYNRENKEGRNFQTVCRLRTSGACFILAEAYCRNGQESLAKEVMNRYLSERKAVTLPPTITGEELLHTIMQEKWKEFAGEGERYFDLKRLRKTTLQGWNKANGMNAVKPAESNDYRWNFPIPKEEYLYNNQMTQNEGWPQIIR